MSENSPLDDISPSSECNLKKKTKTITNMKGDKI